MRISYPSITRDCAERLLEMARARQGDPLGYEASGGDMVEVDCDVDNVNCMDELATLALRGDRAMAARLATWPTLRRLDNVTRSLLQHLGVDPDAARTLADVLGRSNMDLELVDAEGDDDSYVVVTSTPLAWTVHLKPGSIAWNSVGLLLTPPLPEQVSAVAPGRPLRAVVSHPALDRHDLVVTEITSGANTSTVAVDAAGARE